MSVLFNKFSNNQSLTKLLSLVFEVSEDVYDLPGIANKLVGDWELAEWGYAVHVTWENPYKCESGYLFTLPGLSGDFISKALVHIPHTEEDSEIGVFFTLRHLACVASTIELEVSKW